MIFNIHVYFGTRSVLFRIIQPLSDQSRNSFKLLTVFFGTLYEYFWHEKTAQSGCNHIHLNKQNTPDPVRNASISHFIYFTGFHFIESFFCEVN